jgi:hypothetical protein
MQSNPVATQINAKNRPAERRGAGCDMANGFSVEWDSVWDAGSKANSTAAAPDTASGESSRRRMRQTQTMRRWANDVRIEPVDS